MGNSMANLKRRVADVTRPARFMFDRLTYESTGNSRSILDLKGRFANKPLLIVANGPSLNKTPLDEFDGIPSIGMNKIDLIYGRVKWRPSLVVCTNHLVAQQNAEKFLMNPVPVYLSWRTRWFIPGQFKDKLNFFLEKVDIPFSHDCAKGIAGGATVTYAALQLAYYMDADPVIIVGLDHSFDSKGPAHNIERRTGQDNNHFDPNYFAHGQLWGVPNLTKSEEQYQEAKDNFDKKGVQVYDATIGGRLEIFQKISIEEALNKVGR